MTKPVNHVSSRQHILFVAPSAYVLGGMASCLDGLLPGLRDIGWRVTLGLVEGPSFHRTEPYLRSHAFQPAIAIPCMTGTPVGRRRAMTAALRRVQPQIVATFNIPDAVLAVDHLRRSGRSGMRVVMTIHGFDQYHFNDLKFLTQAVDGVICANRLASVLASDYVGVDPHRVFYAPCGVSLTERRGTDSGQRPVRIAWIGRVEEETKRVQDLVGIASELQEMKLDFELWVVGDGSARGRLESAMVSKVGNRARFLGEVARERLGKEVYNEVELLLVTSEMEAGPLVTREAMAHGVVVVSSQHIGSGVEGALVHGENALLFKVGDSVDAATQVRKIVDEPELRARLVEAAYRLVEGRYSTRVSVQAWDRAFRRVLELPEAPWTRLGLSRTSGRLDRLFGPELAESVRASIGRVAPIRDAGSEWPHTLSSSGSDQEFIAVCKRIESGVERGNTPYSDLYEYEPDHPSGRGEPTSPAR